MAIETTEKLNLSLPNSAEHYSVDLYNNNFQKIDSSIKDIENHLGSEVNDLAQKLGIKEYDETINYVSDDLCSYSGRYYKCILTTTGKFDSSCWEETSIKNELAALEKKSNDLINQVRTEFPRFQYNSQGEISGYTTSTGGADTVFPFSGGKKILSSYIQHQSYKIPSKRFLLELVGFRNMYSGSNGIRSYRVSGATIEKVIGAYFTCICSSGYSCVSGNVGVIKLICTGTPGATITPTVYFNESNGATGDSARMSNWIVTLTPLEDE